MRRLDRRSLALGALPVAAVAAAVVVARVLGPSGDIPYTLFVAAVFVSAWFGGLRAAIAALALSIVSAYVFSILPDSKGDSLANFLVRAGRFTMVAGLLVWLTEARRRADRALRESEERFRGTFENAAVGVAHHDVEGRFLRVNERCCQIVGYTREELLGRCWQDLTLPADLADEADRYDALVRGERPGYSLEKPFVGKDGSIAWIDLAVSLRRDAEGRPAYVIAVLQDISDRKRLEEELRGAKVSAEAAGARVTRILESITDAFFALDRDWRFTYINPQAEALMRRSRGELLGMVFWDAFSEAVGSTFERMYREAVATGRSLTFEEYYPPFESWFEVRTYPSADGLSVYFRDVTERRRADEALRRANDRLHLAVQSSNVGIWEVESHDGTFENRREHYTNVLEPLGYETPPETTDSAIWQALVHPDDADRVDRAVRAFYSDRPRDYVLEFRLRHRDGSYRWFVSRGTAICDAAGRFIRGVGTCIDITDLRRAEEALRQSEGMFRGTFENAAVGIDHVDLEGRVVRINQKFCEILGYTREELRTKTWMEFTHPDDLADDLDLYGRLLRGELASYGMEKRYIRKDGTIVWVDLTVSLQRDAAGRPAYCIAIVQDTSERKRLEEALRESEAWFRFLANAMPQIVWTARPDGSCDYLNQRCEEYTGIPVAEMLGDGWLSAVHPDDRDRTAAGWMASIGAESDHDVEFRLRGADGRHRWFMNRGLPVRDESGRVVKWLGTCTNVDALRRAEEALRESERRFRTLAEALPHMVWTADPDGSHDYFNARNTEYSGMAIEQLRGWDWQATVHPDDLSRCLELWSRSVATGELYEIEYRLRRADGAYRWHLARALPLRDDSGRVTKWFGSCVDIDDQKRAEEAERRAKEAAEAASRAKSEFLANVSHEIRTPMNAILGMTELAIDTPGNGEQRQYLTIVKSSADALLNVINDLLDFSKIEAGKLELDPAEFSLRQVLGETLRALALRAHKKGLELVCQIEPDVPDALIGDAGRLRQVLLNLVGNAIKFTEEGEVVVQVEAAPPDALPAPESPGEESGPSRELRFSVRDTGIGIPPEKQRKIFQAFEQEDNSTTRRYGGTGLGLAIASQLVMLMHGAIDVESEPGRGSTFRFTARFGLRPEQPGRSMVLPLVELQGLRVLMVDDNATNRQILEGWFRGWRTEPTVASDGLEALDALWRASASGRPFPLVVLDARMPGIDGPFLAERILQSPELSRTRIILLTSDDRHGEVARFRELGIAAYAMKPVQQEELLEIIYRVLSRPVPIAAPVAGALPPSPPSGDDGPLAAPDPAAAPPSTGEASLRILLAEDNVLNQQLVEHLLRRRGHEVVVAPDGRKALEALDDGPFDLMLLDIQMPEFDGFQVIEAIRRREQTAGGHLPVVAMTAHAMKGYRERCLRAGMDDYLSKPIRSGELFAVIDRVKGARPAAEPPPTPTAQPELVIDADTLLSACDDDPILLATLVRVFQSNLPGSLDRVRDAVARKDPARLRESAHQLRSLIGTFSPRAAQAAARLEAMGAGDELGDAEAALEDLVELSGRIEPSLDGLSIETLHGQAERSRE